MDFPGEKLVIKLWETLAEKGIGSLLRPWQIRREGKARIDVQKEAIVAITEAEILAEEIRSGRAAFRNGALVALPAPIHSNQLPSPDGRIEPTIDLASLVQFATDSELAESIRREINVSKAILHAESILENDSQEPTEAVVDEDWLCRWRDCASSISADRLQGLWGQLLAGELKSPGSFSLRTLEVLKNISQSEAKDIERLAPFVIENGIYRGNMAYLSGQGITFEFLLNMQELGIISGIESIGLTVKWDSIIEDGFLRALISHKKLLLIKHADQSRTFSLPFCKLTIIGRQLLSLGTFEPNIEYMRLIGNAIKVQGLDVLLADWVPADAENMRFFNETYI